MKPTAYSTCLGEGPFLKSKPEATLLLYSLSFFRSDPHLTHNVTPTLLFPLPLNVNECGSKVYNTDVTTLENDEGPSQPGSST